MPRRFTLTIFLLTLSLIQNAQSQERGEEVYMQRCFWCHGEQGDGNGPSAVGMTPRPRDFTRAQFKIRSTPHGQLPTDEDLTRTIMEGIPGTAMVGWKAILSKQEIADLVAYAKSFSPRFDTEEVELLAIPAGAASVDRGKEVYETARCRMCHGEGHRGEGDITTTLNFEWGVPYTARDFTRGWTFKGGHEPRDIYLRITGGLNGTPMGPYRDLLTDEQRWDLVHYIASLDEEPNETSEDFVITAGLIPGDIPEDPGAPEWSNLTPIVVPLAGQVVLDPPLRWWIPTSGAAKLRALWNQREVAFLLEWDDPTGPDTSAPDSAFLQFAVKDGSKPYFLLGDADNPVKVWHWQAENESEEWAAQGIDHVAIAPAGFSVASAWDKGRWRVIFRRILAGEPEFRPGNFVPILISVRDGANGERENVRAISTWIYASLESPKTLRPWLVAIAFLLGAVAVEMWIVARLRS